jgi:ADP-ribose pyrophosphatase
MPTPNVPKIKSSDIIFEEGFIKIRRDTLLLEDNSLHPYYTLITKPAAVAILATTPDGLYVLNQEHRYPVAKALLSSPGGFIDAGENPLEAAQRELAEETGYVAESFTLIGRAYPHAGMSAQQTFYVRATGAQLATCPHLDATEVMTTILISKNNLQQLIRQGDDVDGTLCTALYFEHLWNEQIKTIS